MSVLPAVVVAPDRFSWPELAASTIALFADVVLPARLTALPLTVALPPATLRPVALTLPDALTLRSPDCASDPSPFMPAASVPVEPTLAALIVVLFCAASKPLLVSAPDVLALTLPCA